MVAPLVATLLLAAGALQDEGRPRESDYYRIVTLHVPDDVVLEVSGIALLADGRPLVCTRRGEVYVVEGAYGDPALVRYHKFTEGLQEPLGLLVHEGWIYCTQRGELSRMRDVDGDDRADEIETVCDAWRISGNYHEYNFGPRVDGEGNFWITTNKPFGGEPFGRQMWRGFALRITPGGEMVPTCCGLRSPAGVEVSPWGDVFYTDNQGEWCGASKLSRLVPGSFHGHPHGIFSCDDPLWPYPHPGDPASGTPMPRVAGKHPSFELPAVWFPYDKMGRSPAGMVWDRSEGGFGPFAGQLFVTDQYDASVMRVYLEEVGGHWQGACFPFRFGLQCGAIRCAWGADGSLLVGMTNRGWGGRGNSPYGLQRLVWTGKTPFEIQALRAAAGGFELVLTAPVDEETAKDAGSYRMESYTYRLHSDYGSPEIDRAEPRLVGATVSGDGTRVRLEYEGLRPGYVHELHADGLRARDGRPLLHAEAYYTLVKLPGE